MPRKRVFLSNLEDLQNLTIPIEEKSFGMSFAKILEYQSRYLYQSKIQPLVKAFSSVYNQKELFKAQENGRGFIPLRARLKE